MAYKAAFYLNSACQVHCFLDDDKEGRPAFERAQGQNLLEIRDVNFCTCWGMHEAELEDVYDKDVYRQQFLLKFGVDVKLRIPGRRKKWSEQAAGIFKASGKPWGDRVKHEVKAWLADFASEHPNEIIHPKAGIASTPSCKALTGGYRV